jgi:restriction system protein
MVKPKSSKAEFTKWFGPVLDALRANKGSAKPKEIYKWIGDNLKLPESVIKERYEKSGQLKFHNQVAWARQYLVWEGLLESAKHGVWALTKKGQNTHIKDDAAQQIFIKWTQTFRELRDNKAEQDASKDIEDTIKLQEFSEPENDKSLVQPTLLEVLQKVTPEGFEHICGRLLRAHGFDDVNVTQRSRDGGIDGYGILQINPLLSLSVSFQCKRYQGTVPTKDVQAFIGAMESGHKRYEKGLFITTGNFASEAERIGNSNNKLELIDGDKLVEMFEKAELGLIAKTIYDVDMNYFRDFMETEEDKKVK